MLMIRLQRTGKKHQPSYRLVLVDSRRATKSGSFIEILGSYNIIKGQTSFDAEKIKSWIGKGAQVSDTVHNLLIKEKIIQGKKRDILQHNKIKKTAEPKKVEAKAELQNNNTQSENV